MIGVAFAVAAVTPPAWAAGADAASERDFVQRTNAARVSGGAKMLDQASDLIVVARRHSAEMAASGRLFHSTDLGSKVGGWQVLGENVGRGGSVAAVHEAFMASPSHRDNILKAAYTQVGIGVVWAGNVLYVTEVFRRPTDPSGPTTPVRPAATLPAARPVAIRPPATKVTTVESGAGSTITTEAHPTTQYVPPIPPAVASTTIGRGRVVPVPDTAGRRAAVVAAALATMAGLLVWRTASSCPEMLPTSLRRRPK